MPVNKQVIDDEEISGALTRAKSSELGLRGQLKQFTRDRLITAAMDSFAAVGFRATTVERIVDQAGTTTPTFYRHFASKNDLLAPLQERLGAEVREVFLKLNDIEQPSFALIRSWFDSYIQMWLRVHKLCVAYWEAAELDSDLAADAFPSARLTVSMLDRFLARYPPAEREPIELRLALTISLLDRATQVIVAVREEKTKARLLDEYTNMMVLALRHPGPAD